MDLLSTLQFHELIEFLDDKYPRHGYSPRVSTESIIESIKVYVKKYFGTKVYNRDHYLSGEFQIYPYTHIHFRKGWFLSTRVLDEFLRERGEEIGLIAGK